MALLALDALGRRRRVYRRRVHPYTEFHEQHFQARYRLSTHAVQYLVGLYGNYVDIMGLAHAGGLTLEDRFCLGLRYFATGSNYSVVADMQGVSKATVSRSVQSVSNFLYAESDRWIKWPDRPIDKLRAAVEWQEVKGHPRVIGAIDGCHVPIRRPRDNDGAFINRHGYHSINAMMACNANLEFIHVDPTWPGSVGDAHVWNNSLLHDQQEANDLDPFFLLGDGGYGCSKNLFTPLRFPQTQSDLEYNRWHRSTRSFVERSFGRLKQRWRCLDAHGGYLFHNPERSGKIITACAALHNVALQFNVPILPDHDMDAFVGHHLDPGQPPQAQPPEPGQERFVARTNFIYDRF